MLLKRVYDRSGPTPRLTGVQLIRAGERQCFTPRLIQRGIAEGWLSIGGGTVNLLTDPPATYRIVRVPGYYCCHCQQELPDATTGLGHVKSAHAGKDSPDRSNPLGLRLNNFYECTKEKGTPVKSAPPQDVRKAAAPAVKKHWWQRGGK